MTKHIKDLAGVGPRYGGGRKNLQHLSAVDGMSNEPQLWANQVTNATTALSFWATFLDLRVGSDDHVLDLTGTARLLTLIRAVSWVESQHGTGSGIQPARDPMQCGNPSDSWWKELVGPAGQGDRLIGGPNAGNYFAGDLAAAVQGNSSFPSSAKLSVLGNQSLGHDDANFSAIMSYCWALPILVHKMNTKAGDKTYQCGDFSQQRAIDGAAEYNGTGDAGYRQKVTDALNSIGWPSLLKAVDLVGARDAGAAFQDILEKTVKTITSAATAPNGGGHARLFFPNGIELIDVHVKVASVDLEVKIAGPKTGLESTSETAE
jgi:hypothetical protein